MEIKLENVHYSIKMPNKTILEDINLNICDNKITAIMGRSGSGKTTIAEIISLLSFPTEGNIYFDKKIVAFKQENKIKDLRYKVGLVFQFPEEQFFSNTVANEIGFCLKYLNKSPSEIKKRIEDSLIMVDLDIKYFDRKISTLSSGEKRRVAIASILAFNPEVILLDEPTIGLDSASIKSLISILKMLKNRYNKTIVIISRDSDFVHSICDNVSIIHNGKIVLSGNKYDVFTKDIEKYGLKKPKIIEFEQMVLKNKNIKLLYRDDINDLMKDVYRSVK